MKMQVIYWANVYLMVRCMVTFCVLRMYSPPCISQFAKAGMPVIALPRIRVWISCNKQVSASIVLENGGSTDICPCNNADQAAQQFH